MSMRVIPLALGALFLFVHAAVSADTLSELQRADKLRIKAWIEPKQDITAKQQVKLHIEIATDRWFSRGVRFGQFEIEDAIVLQRDNFALNSTRNQNGKSWTIQQWTLVVYPQRDGEFVVPAIPVILSIAGENLQAITGRVYTKPMSFVASIPTKLKEINNWIASTRFEIKSSFNRPFEELKPGDALIRTIQLSADDLPAMMLPEVEAEDIPGIAIYKKSPVVADKVNRGEYLAERTESLTYVFEKAGDYRLPPLTYYWWNLESGALEVVELAAIPLRVVGPLSTKDAAGDVARSNENESIDVRSLLIKFTSVIILLLGIWIVVHKILRYLKAKRPEKTAVLSERDLHRKFEQACQDRDLSKAVSLFYQWLDLYAGESFRGSVRLCISDLGRTQAMSEFNMIMRSIYSS
ncbi:MAG: hypothetical protein ACC707_17335, partial [Thiohalomonadales bacterium]